MAFGNDFVNWIGSGLKKVGGKIGEGINWVGNKVGGAWEGFKKIPVIGNVIGSSPIGQSIESGLGIARHVGNTLEGKENLREGIEGVLSGLGKPYSLPAPGIDYAKPENRRWMVPIEGGGNHQRGRGNARELLSNIAP